MQKLTPLRHGQYYHIYNCGINGEPLFKYEMDYMHFLNLYGKYIDPVADTFSWCLMGNHFHLLVKVKKKIIYKHSNADRSVDTVRFEEAKWETVNLSPSEGHDCV